MMLVKGMWELFYDEQIKDLNYDSFEKLDVYMLFLCCIPIFIILAICDLVILPSEIGYYFFNKYLYKKIGRKKI